MIYTRRFRACTHLRRSQTCEKERLLLLFLCEPRGSASLDNPLRLRRCRGSLGREGGDKGGDEGVSSILQYASKTKTESLCPSAKYEMSLMSWCFFLSNTQTHSSTTKKKNTHTQKNHKSSEAKVIRTLRRRESLIIYCLPCCLTPLTALRSLQLTLSLLTRTHTHTLCRGYTLLE